MGRDELTEVLSRLADARAQVYTLLSLAFSTPDEELAEGLWNGEFFLGFLRALHGSRAPLCPADIWTLADYEDIPTASALAQALQLEYTRLFVGPYTLPAPPYESVYREPTWGVMGETTREVRHAYEAASLTFEPGVRELPDHVGIELEFLACLSEEEAKAWAADDEPSAIHWLEHEHTFLDRHLCQWLPAFTDRVLAATTCSFYSGLARIAQVFVTHVREQVAAVVHALSDASEASRSSEGRGNPYARADSCGSRYS